MRDYAAQKGLAEEAALQAGMKEKAEEFKKSGGQIYVEAASSESSSVEFKAWAKE